MQPLWCHLQSHHFKGTKAPRCHHHKEQMHPLTSSFVLLSLNDNSPVESPYMVKGELHSVLYNQVFLGFCPLALCTTATMTSFLYSSSILVTWKKLPWCRKNLCTYMYICVLERVYVCIYCVHAFERKVVVCAENPMITVLPVRSSPKAPIGNAHKQGMMWWDKAIIQPPQ